MRWNQHQAGLLWPGPPPGPETFAFSCLVGSRVTPQLSCTPAIRPINGYLAEGTECCRSREEVLWLQCISLLCCTSSCNYLFCEEESNSNAESCNISILSTNLISSLLLLRTSHVHLSMLSRHLKISKPIWHYLHHGRPLNLHQWSGFGKQLSRCRTLVIWQESALTRLDATEEASPRGREGWVEKGGPREETWALMQYWDKRELRKCLRVKDTRQHTQRHASWAQWGLQGQILDSERVLQDCPDLRPSMFHSHKNALIHSYGIITKVIIMKVCFLLVRQRFFQSQHLLMVSLFSLCL